jgi:hypothetical protein
MINAKVKMFGNTYIGDLQTEVNSFFETIDIRQVIKMENFATGDSNKKNYCVITYVEMCDIRDAKVDKILEI